MARRRRRTNRKSNNNFWTVVIIILFLFWFISTKGGSDPNGHQVINRITQNQHNSINNQIEQAKPAEKVYGGLSKSDYKKLAQLDFKSGDSAYITVNNDHSTLIKSAWRVNRVIYSNLDNLNRTSHSNTAFLEKRNVASDELRVRQFVEPTAWHYNRHNDTQIYNRGHMIAYSVSAGIDLEGNYNPRNLSGDQNNPKNLFTQSAFCNQKIQTIFESRVRRALRQNQRVIYQATPIFRNNELMARGINLQAISTDGGLDFNVYLFNVQPGFSFDYNNGRARIDHELQVKEEY
ncbi:MULTISPECIES: DNA/RNA non-specific endonuclease [unclassified Lactobacillus]|uniref:DNA/RNA non-specific endonuclease n=1 Tax=unclassified Lactobacillus TaxID=2620435 RepID=UPI000EFC5CFB|nr:MULTISPECIES: DNA/RNA non-specific endonuclease [unclassified Lactobacillus]RMC25800.1 DNA/RNA non-specific endonuclease [Lactobacillus sp. ESL0247]RMC29612.1 DNA/RNA non-specific endonuclease [Lactobacillus sp. ESL0246]RMC33601.1 DNA/RNA non-specific endonuclease [Lactobacillus sp. ESL0245]RMC51612.1 DNA/RNA non-specific endonuclease [Lactobacillus sp. ESL0228]